MMRMINFLLIALMLVGAGVVYDFKYEAEKATAKVARINRKIETEKDAIATLKAEWSLLNQPKRLQELAEKHHAYLELDPLDPTQIGSLDDVPFKPAVPRVETPPTGSKPAGTGTGTGGTGGTAVASTALPAKPATKTSIKLGQPEKAADHPASIGKFLDRLPQGPAKSGSPATTGSIPKAATGAPMMLAPLPPRPPAARPPETKVIR
jgi:cell division protein FtsL